MSRVDYVGMKTFPEQGTELHKEVVVSFSRSKFVRGLIGTIVRDDKGESGVTVIKLKDGRYILGSECYYAVAPPDYIQDKKEVFVNE